MKKSDQIADVEKLIGLMTKYLTLAVKNKSSLSPEQLMKAKKIKEEFSIAQNVRKKLLEAAKTGKQEDQQNIDPQAQKFLDETKKMIDSFDTEMKYRDDKFEL